MPQTKTEGRADQRNQQPKGKGVIEQDVGTSAAGISGPSTPSLVRAMGKLTAFWAPPPTLDVVRPPAPDQVGNFDQFMNSTSPVINARYFYKRNSGGWSHPDMYSYFVLGDLWKSFEEWSAFGAGVPLVMNGNNNVVQYYVPYLSGMQLYRKPTGLKPRIDTVPRVSGISSGETQSKPHLIFEFFESRPPYIRDPLADKVSCLAEHFPELETCESCDLHISSWISVAWYPIYRIPVGSSLQNIEAAFLTFHSLATASKAITNPAVDDDGTESFREATEKSDEIPDTITLPTFGMATFRFQRSLWTYGGISENDPTSLLEEAELWLQNLNADHPDFKFFTGKKWKPSYI